MICSISQENYQRYQLWCSKIPQVHVWTKNLVTRTWEGFPPVARPWMATTNCATGSWGNLEHEIITWRYLHIHSEAHLHHVSKVLEETWSCLRHHYSWFELEQETLASTGLPLASRQTLWKDYAECASKCDTEFEAQRLKIQERK